MTNKNEQRKVPELRFPEYSGEWGSSNLENLSTVTSGKRLPKNHSLNSDKANTPYISVSDMGEKYVNKNNLMFISKNTESIINNYKVYSGDLIFSIAGTLGKVNIIDDSLENSNLTENCNRISNFKINRDFLFNQLKCNRIMKYIDKNKTKSSLDKLSLAKLRSLIIYYPTTEEQQKIGEFFSKLDRQIELEEKKLALLEEQKKGYMQKIFSQELRFKDENSEEYPEWEDLRLGDIFQEVNDKTSINNEYPILSSTNNGLFSQKDYFKHQVASTNNIGYKILKKNQVVLSPQNLWLGNININFKFEEGIVSPSYKIFNIINSNPLFISYILKRPKMLFEYKNASEQGASIVRRNLNLDLFYNIKLRLPSYEEQTSIQNFLSAIENQIDRSDYKIKMLNLRKNYLLNKIFL